MVVHETEPTETLGLAAYRVMYENSPDGVLFATPGGPVTAANPAACAMLRMSEQEIIETGDALQDTDDPRWQLGTDQRERTGVTSGRARVRRGDGTTHEFELSSRIFRDADGTRRTIIFVRDPMDQAAIEDEIEKLTVKLHELSLTDDLTGLHNRRGLLADGGHLLDLADRQDSDVQVLFVDVDNVTDLNTQVGLHGGDAGLQAVARALTVAFRRTDVLARIGGTQFIALAFNLRDTDRPALAERLRQHLASPETTRVVGAEVEVSLGWVTRRPGETTSIEKLVAGADWAMHEAREAAREVAAAKTRHPSTPPPPS
jgi:diguanylate cyclase (GGDEF)-like protein/PAS domain S-box-containing protein